VDFQFESNHSGHPRRDSRRPISLFYLFFAKTKQLPTAKLLRQTKAMFACQLTILLRVV
jgi:hypothetical protein